MARTRKQARSATKGTKKSAGFPFHAFWSGALSFGLVRVPVYLFPATRHSGVRLRMMSPGGALLERRYYCPREAKQIVSDELVRGYELDNGSYIIVTDGELAAAEPVKSQEIELRQFVRLSDVTPAIMERGYYLTPGKGAAKAYTLLAEAMEKTRRAGIATFVMRDREYLVAIFAEKGILRAQTLRFYDELRHPQTIGLPEPVAPSKQRISACERAVSALKAKTLSRDLLADVDAEKLKGLIARKKRSGKDVITLEHSADDDESSEENDVDLLQTIRRSLRMVSGGGPPNRNRAGPSRKQGNGQRKAGRPATISKKRSRSQK